MERDPRPGKEGRPSPEGPGICPGTAGILEVTRSVLGGQICSEVTPRLFHSNVLKQQVVREHPEAPLELTWKQRFGPHQCTEVSQGESGRAEGLGTRGQAAEGRFQVEAMQDVGPLA